MKRNTRIEKRDALYDGHNVKPGANAARREATWRRLRRRWSRWLKGTAQGVSTGE